MFTNKKEAGPVGPELTDIITRNSKRRLPKVVVPIVGVAAIGAPLAWATVASADYGGSLASSSGGATLGFTVNRLSLDSAELTGQIRDTRDDGRCAYAKVTVMIDFALDPASSATTCGIATSKRVHVYTFDPKGWDRVQGIKVQVCRRAGATGSTSSCRERVLSKETF